MPIAPLMRRPLGKPGRVGLTDFLLARITEHEAMALSAGRQRDRAGRVLGATPARAPPPGPRSRVSRRRVALHDSADRGAAARGPSRLRRDVAASQYRSRSDDIRAPLGLSARRVCAVPPQAGCRGTTAGVFAELNAQAAMS